MTGCVAAGFGGGFAIDLPVIGTLVGTLAGAALAAIVVARSSGGISACRTDSSTLHLGKRAARAGCYSTRSYNGIGRSDHRQPSPRRVRSRRLRVSAETCCPVSWGRSFAGLCCPRIFQVGGRCRSGKSHLGVICREALVVIVTPDRLAPL